MDVIWDFEITNTSAITFVYPKKLYVHLVAYEKNLQILPLLDELR